MHAVLLVLALAASDPPQSVDHVRAGLDKPKSKLSVPEVKPDFKVQIEERRPLQDLFDIPPWALEPHGWQPPGPVMKSAFGTPMFSVDLLGLFRKTLPAYISQEPNLPTKLAIDKYCAAQPKDGRRILICEN
jgi:hypothetical protein